MSAAFWQPTAAALAPLLPAGKPALTPELLSRPPFRYLHDITTEVARVSGFPEAAIQGNVDSRSLDKDGKLAFLQKLVGAIGDALGVEVPARPSKIVAGLEPAATNIMLQMLAEAAQAHMAGGGAAAPAPTSQAAVASLGRHSAPVAAGSRGDEEDAVMPGIDQEAQPAVVFASLGNLLPALARRVEEARAVLGGMGEPAGSAAAAAQARCTAVNAVAQDAAALARCLEGLRSTRSTIRSESIAWGEEAGRLAARVQQEERTAGEAAAAATQRMARLEGQVAAARQRLAILRRG